MEISVYTQLVQTGIALALGAMAGLLYDLLRAFRRRIKLSIIVAIADIVFWVIVGLALIVVGMVVGQGQVRIYMIICSIAGAVLYFSTVSKLTLRICDLFWDVIIKIFKFFARPFIYIGKKLKKATLKFKKYFKNLKKWGTIGNGMLLRLFRRPNKENNATGDELGESKKGRKVYEVGSTGTYSLRAGEYNKSSGSNSRGKRTPDRNRKSNRRGKPGKGKHGV